MAYTTKIADGVEAQLPHDVAAVSLHGLGAQVQQAGDFLRAVAFCQQLSDLAFAGG